MWQIKRSEGILTAFLLWTKNLCHSIMTNQLKQKQKQMKTNKVLYIKK